MPNTRTSAGSASGSRPKPRCVALVGPQGAGKTTLLRALVARATGSDASAVGDHSAESRDFAMSTEPNFAAVDYLGDPWSIIDCPGSIELLQDSLAAMAAADMVILVTEPDPSRAAALQVYLQALDAAKIPHALFINKMDTSILRVRDLLETLQTASARPLVLRQVPIRENGKIVGAIDLASERAWEYRDGAPSRLIEMPADLREREAEARDVMLDTLADFDDSLMEQILDDKAPPSETIYALMAKDEAEDLIVPVFLGVAAESHGITRLWKMLRHEAPSPDMTAARRGLAGPGQVLSVVKTLHQAHTGKLSIARLWHGTLKDGETVAGARLNGLCQLQGDERLKCQNADGGALVGLPRLEALATGDLVVDGTVKRAKGRHSEPLAPVYQHAIRTDENKDEVKLSAALSKLLEEDPSLTLTRREDTNEIILGGQGEIHLRLALAKLANRFGLQVAGEAPRPAFRETIQAPTRIHSRHKKQSGGHGQFADILLEISPQTRGEGFQFASTIHGGVVPKQFIPAVESGIKEGLVEGPLGFPVIDLAVTLTDGRHHAVDSNEMSFKIAGRTAIKEALPDAQPVLLEPIFAVTIQVPSDATSKVLSTVSTRRGQILGFESREGWSGWDTVESYLPESALSDLIIELRSLSQGVASFSADFSHYQELFGRDAAVVVTARKEALT